MAAIELALALLLAVLVSGYIVRALPVPVPLPIVQIVLGWIISNRLHRSDPGRLQDPSVNPVWLPLRGQPAFQALVKKYDASSQPTASASVAAPASTAPQ